MFGKNNNAKKVITYAASCGHTTYDELVKYNKEQEVSALLNELDIISVRDVNTKNFVESLTHHEPILHLDPVLIYDFSNELKPINFDLENYIIVYSYPFNLTDEECNYIRQFAKKHNKTIVTIGSYQKCSDIYISAHPLEVINYFKKASFIITNTFHGTIFSIKAHTPFATFIRKDVNAEKLSDLLDRLNFKARQLNSYSEIENIYNKSIDFSYSDDLLKLEKERSIEYLKNNI